MVRHPGISNGTNENAIEVSSLKDGESIRWHQGSFTQIALRTPIELLDVKAKATMDVGKGRERLYTLCNDLRPNAITRQHS
jgi:hypothetical protein